MNMTKEERERLKRIELNSMPWWRMLIPWPPKWVFREAQQLRIVWQILYAPLLAMQALGLWIVTMCLGLIVVIVGPLAIAVAKLDRITVPKWVDRIFCKQP